MPCFTETTEEEREEAARAYFRHNSDVAEMLCTVCKRMTVAQIANVNGLAQWWADHQIRDKKQKEDAKKDLEYNKRLREWERKKPKR